MVGEFAEAVRVFGETPEMAQFFASPAQFAGARRRFGFELQLLRVALYHRGQLSSEPRRSDYRGDLPVERPVIRPRMTAVIQRYLASKRLDSRPKTVDRFDLALGRFLAWLTAAHPELDSLGEVTREHVLEYAAALDGMISMQTGQLLSRRTKEGYLASVSVFFRETGAWGWAETPGRPLLLRGELPRRAQSVPRYIPEAELARLMDAIRELPCPYQQTALLVARWSGARRDEIRRLEVDCLDAYPDGTARLRIPSGKTYQERMVPLHEEAAEAIHELQALRRGEPARGFRDELTGRIERRLFVHHGKTYSAEYLFEAALDGACRQAGLVDRAGRPTVTAHRFRHTVGTQLAERGARLHTIMKVLGHQSAGMSIVYAQISDQEVLKDYQAVLGPGATVAGPYAETLRTGELSASAVEWLKTNFFKTELELGRCLRLPQEGPCECDLYLSCAKFVTTPEYAPRLRRRRQVELTLIRDAAGQGWIREVERHRCTVQRIDQLLAELNEPADGPVDE
jgi:integrase